MRYISLWAKHNPVKARSIIILIKIILALFAIATGLLFAGLDIHFGAPVLYISALMMFISLLFYPRKNNGKRLSSYHYARQKTCDFLIAVCSFISIMTLANGQIVNISSQQQGVIAATIHRKPTAAEILESLKHRDKNSLTREEKKILKKEFFKQVKVYAVSSAKNDKETRKNAGLIILTIVASLGLTFLLAALVCSLSCNGSDVAAGIVGIVGLVALIWGSIAVINAIVGGPKKKKTTDTSQ